jgi:cysteine synthase
VIPEATSSQKRNDMRRYGAELVVVPGDTTELALEEAYRLRDAGGGTLFMTDQYTNRANLRAHYLTTGPEILAQCPDVTHVVAAQGSFGTLGGISLRMREERPDVEIHAVVARPGAKTLFGIKEAHQVMPLVDDSLLAGRTMVGGSEAAGGIEAAMRFGYQLGPSSGAVLAAALRLARRIERGSIVCIFADSGNKYPECPLYVREEWSRMKDDEVDHAGFVRW